MTDLTMALPTKIVIGLAVTFLVFLLLLLRNLMRRRPSGFIAACVVVLGIFLAYQFALGSGIGEGHAAHSFLAPFWR